jgi:hypothetical protein
MPIGLLLGVFGGFNGAWDASTGATVVGRAHSRKAPSGRFGVSVR